MPSLTNNSRLDSEGEELGRKGWRSRLVLLTGLVCIVAACTQASSPPVAPTPTPHAVVPTTMPTSSPSPTATPLGGPFAQLGPLPKDCPAGPIPQIISSDLGPAAGANPVWVGAGNFRLQPPLALIWSPADAQFYHDQYGWEHKFLYVVATSYQGQVEIHGANLSDGSPLYLGAQDAVTTGTATTLL